MAKKTLRISGQQLREYLARTGRSQSGLAKLLNVNPASITRWVEDDTEKYPQVPTSTALLVLVPLLLSENVNILPPPSDEQIDAFAARFTRLGLLTKRELKNPKTMKALKRVITMESSRELTASKKLFEALQEAWKRLDDLQRFK